MAVKTRKNVCIVHFQGSFKFYWELLIVAITIYNCFSMPVVLAFKPSSANSTEWYLHLYAMTAIFAVDLIVNFRTTYFDSVLGDEVLDGKKIFLNYLISLRFWIDLLTTIPWDILLKGTVSDDVDGGLACIRIIKIVRAGSIS